MNLSGAFCVSRAYRFLAAAVTRAPELRNVFIFKSTVVVAAAGACCATVAGSSILSSEAAPHQSVGARLRLPRRRTMAPCRCEERRQLGRINLPRLIPQELLSEGTLDANYNVLEQVGVGQFGTVFRAIDRTTGVRRAVKRLRKTVRRLEQRLILSEVALLRHIGRKKRIVSLVDCYEDDQYVYLVLEFCHGMDLFDWYSFQEGLSERHWAVLLREMFLAIASCHSKGVMHLDVKPENFITISADLRSLLDKAVTDGTNKHALLLLADFGVSKFVQTPLGYNKWITAAADRFIGGTPLYMAPETVHRSECSFKCDVWSLGVTMFSFLTGEYLSEVGEHTNDDVISRLAELGIGDSFTDILRRMLEYDPQKRITVDDALDHPFLRVGLKRASTGQIPKYDTRKECYDAKHVKSHEEEFRKTLVLRRTKGCRMWDISLEPGECLFEKGDTGSDLYFVRSGRMEVWDGDLYIASVQPGGVVGEMALMLNQPRSATARCAPGPPEPNKESGNCSLLCIPPDAIPHLKAVAPLEVGRFRELADQRDMTHQAFAWLESTELFRRANKKFLRRLAQRAVPVSLQKDEVLMRQGDYGKAMFLVRKGSLDVYVQSEEETDGQHCTDFGIKIAELGVGAAVGERALIEGTNVRSATVVAPIRCELLKLSRKDFIELTAAFRDETKSLRRLAERLAEERQHTPLP